MRVCRACEASIEHRVKQARYCSIECQHKVNKSKPAYRHKRKLHERARRKKLKAQTTFKDTIRGKALALGFRSGFERTLDVQLKQSGIKYEYESLTIPYVREHTYTPDWILSNGIILEAKGILNKRDPQESAKMVAVKKQHPNLDIRFVFMDADKPLARQKQSHAKWATKYGFPYASGRIPEEWLTE